MRCPYCGHLDSRVTDSRDSADGIRRRRECLRCSRRFTTYERTHTSGLMVVKRDGRREDFKREKLLTGIRLACAKRPLPTGVIEKVVDDIEAQLQGLGRAEVESYIIGEAVMERLKHLDRVAYIRFASVYRDFKDVDSFKDELEALEQGEERGPGAQLPLIPLGPPPLQRHPRRGRRPGSAGRRDGSGGSDTGQR